MSNSGEVAVRCTICNSSGGLRCVQCRSVHYCSKECQRIDWPTHMLLCRAFSDFRVPPGPTFKRAILFPDHEETPKFIWVEITTSNDNDDADGEDFTTPDLDGLLGAGERFGSRLVFQKNIFRNRTLENTIAVAHRDAFLKGGSLPNQSISKATRGEHAHPWAGPMVAYQIRGLNISDPCYYGDMTLDDFHHVVDYLVTYDNDSYTVVKSGACTVKGVRVSCIADQTMFGVAKYIPVDIADSHIVQIFGMEEPIGISKLIELPIFVRKCPPHQAWRNDPNAKYTNQAATFLHLDLDPKSEGFGWAPFEWDQRVGTVLAVRADRKALSPHHMEALCHYCQFTLGPMIEDSFGVGLVERTRDEVMRHMTKAKFKQFFMSYKAKQTDPSWAGTPCPYGV